MWLHNDIETEDEGIDNQPLILGGTICSEYTNPESGGVCMPVCPGNICFGVTDPGGYTIDDMLAQLKEDMNKGCTFTISGLGECLNGVYVITSFKLNTIRRSANCFHWEFQLERVEDI